MYQSLWKQKVLLILLHSVEEERIITIDIIATRNKPSYKTFYTEKYTEKR